MTRRVARFQALAAACALLAAPAARAQAGGDRPVLVHKASGADATYVSTELRAVGFSDVRVRDVATCVTGEAEAALRATSAAGLVCVDSSGYRVYSLDRRGLVRSVELVEQDTTTQHRVASLRVAESLRARIDKNASGGSTGEPLYLDMVCVSCGAQPSAPAAAPAAPPAATPPTAAAPSESAAASTSTDNGQAQTQLPDPIWTPLVSLGAALGPFYTGSVTTLAAALRGQVRLIEPIALTVHAELPLSRNSISVVGGTARAQALSLGGGLEVPFAPTDATIVPRAAILLSWLRTSADVDRGALGQESLSASAAAAMLRGGITARFAGDVRGTAEALVGTTASKQGVAEGVFAGPLILAANLGLEWMLP
jgi:hypothetical protein